MVDYQIVMRDDGRFYQVPVGETKMKSQHTCGEEWGQVSVCERKDEIERSVAWCTCGNKYEIISTNGKITSVKFLEFTKYKFNKKLITDKEQAFELLKKEGFEVDPEARLILGPLQCPEGQILVDHKLWKERNKEYNLLENAYRCSKVVMNFSIIFNVVTILAMVFHHCH